MNHSTAIRQGKVMDSAARNLFVRSRSRYVVLSKGLYDAMRLGEKRLQFSVSYGQLQLRAVEEGTEDSMKVDYAGEQYFAIFPASFRKSFKAAKGQYRAVPVEEGVYDTSCPVIRIYTA